MNTIEIKPDVLDEMIRQQTQTLDTLKNVRGQSQRIDRVAELCDHVRISKRSLAGGIILEHGDNITICELAQRLQVARATIYRWPEIVRALKGC